MVDFFSLLQTDTAVVDPPKRFPVTASRRTQPTRDASSARWRRRHRREGRPGHGRRSRGSTWRRTVAVCFLLLVRSQPPWPNAARSRCPGRQRRLRSPCNATRARGRAIGGGAGVHHNPALRGRTSPDGFGHHPRTDCRQGHRVPVGARPAWRRWDESASPESHRTDHTNQGPTASGPKGTIVMPKNGQLANKALQPTRWISSVTTSIPFDGHNVDTFSTGRRSRLSFPRWPAVSRFW